MAKEKKIKNKKGRIGFKILTVLLLLLAVGVYYYLALPAINIHSLGCWIFFLILIACITITGNLVRDFRLQKTFGSKNNGVGPWKFGYLLLGGVVVILLVGLILGAPLINAKKYKNLMTVETREFTQDITEADFSTIPLLDKDSAALLGERKMGSMVEMVSQFEVGNDYTQINYKGRPVRVTPLVYASPIKWLTNQKQGIPAYILIDMATQDTECIKLEKPIKYSESEHFNRNIYRHLRFNYPTAIFADQIFFEIDEEGTPYWICPVKKFNVGLFGGETVSSVVTCNAQTGECTKYDIGSIPQWIDKVYQAELLMQLYDYTGLYKHGFFNSVLGQKDCLKTTNGYNYIALDDDVWVYSGVTSVNGDQSNVGFILMNQRTMETRFYQIEGAIEDSAMASAQGQVQHLGYTATFPLLLNISNEPTYFMALKDEGGLVKMYAMVNIEKYQWVAIGDTVKACEKQYNALLTTNGIVMTQGGENKSVTGKIKTITPVVIDGNTHFYVVLVGKNDIYDVDMTNENVLNVVKYSSGDTITMQYSTGEGLLGVTEVK